MKTWFWEEVCRVKYTDPDAQQARPGSGGRGQCRKLERWLGGCASEHALRVPNPTWRYGRKGLNEGSIGPLGLALICHLQAIFPVTTKIRFFLQAPDGVLCASMSGIYSNAQAKQLPGQQVQKSTEIRGSGDAGERTIGFRHDPGATTRAPIRSAPRFCESGLRQGRQRWHLHDQSYVYLGVDAGKWQIEHNRSRIQDSPSSSSCSRSGMKAAPDG